VCDLVSLRPGTLPARSGRCFLCRTGGAGFVIILKRDGSWCSMSNEPAIATTARSGLVGELGRELDYSRSTSNLVGQRHGSFGREQ
jgi:hypothetical protein